MENYMSLTIDINGRCNIRCEFCYQDLDGSVLDTDKIFSIVDENPGFETIEIGGGEPLLDKRIIDIINELIEREKRIHISTNATHLPEGFLDLEQTVRDNTQIQVSLHASNPGLYREIIGKELFDNHLKQTGENLFDAVISNIEKIKERYLTVISTVAYQKNLKDIPNIVELAYGMDIPIRINLAMPVGNGNFVRRLNAKQLDGLKGYLLGQRFIKGNMVESPLIHINNCYALASAYGIEKEGPCPVDCNAKLYVSPRGEKTICEFYGGK